MSPDNRLPRPGPVHGPYPLRPLALEPGWLALMDAWGAALSPAAWRSAARRRPFERHLEDAEQAGAGEGLDVRAARAARQLRRQGFGDAAVAQAQAAIADAVHRVTGFRPYATQHLAARALVQERMVEMGTGEGKSLAVLMAAATAALAGVPVHVLTVNEYLARRDAAVARRVLQLLGLDAGAIVREMDADERRETYRLDVVYVTAQEVGFDYLRDRLLEGSAEPGRPAARPASLRGLCMALVDEADGILLDQARTPLVLAARVQDTLRDAALAGAVFELSAALRAGADFALDAASRRVELAPDAVLRAMSAPSVRAQGPVDARVLRHLLAQALVARHALRRDVEYVLQDDEVVIVDETTGRTLPDSLWSDGLHAMVCAKEGLEPPPRTRTCGQITLQALLGRYCRLGGISGTLCDARLRLRLLHGLEVRRIAPRLPRQARSLGLRMYAGRERQFEAVAESVRTLRRAGRPTLVGTDSVAAAQALSEFLGRAGIAHALLTARDDRDEAALVAQAGAAGAVTVSTNLAGRGTDIELAPAVAAAGGLHVIACTRNPSSRIDRQLFGRAARNGQPGSHEAVLCLEDAAFAVGLPGAVRRALAGLAGPDGRLPSFAAGAAARWCQQVSEWNLFLGSWQALRHARRERRALLRIPQSD
jgi:preprotein translocase subunit SecA